jgi:hypothetical protein
VIEDTASAESSGPATDETALLDVRVSLGRVGIRPAGAAVGRARLFVGRDSGRTAVDGALGTPTVAIHVGFPAQACAALGDHAEVVAQHEPFADPELATPAAVFAAIARRL